MPPAGQRTRRRGATPSPGASSWSPEATPDTPSRDASSRMTAICGIARPFRLPSIGEERLGGQARNRDEGGNRPGSEAASPGRGHAAWARGHAPPPHGCTVMEVKNGKVDRVWVYFDNAHLLRQIGVLPTR